MGGRVLVERVPQASSADRDAILASLFAERRELNRAKRLGTASANQLEYLSELNDYINSVEAAETREAEEHGVWAKLEDLASAVVDLQVKRSK